MPSNLPRTGRGGGRDPQNRPNEFPDDLNLLRKDVGPETIIFDNVSGANTSRPYCVGALENFSIYVWGTNPDVDIQACMNPAYGLWVTLNTNAIVNEGFYSGDGGQHPWIRVLVNSGTNVKVHLYRKYATY